MELIIFDIKVFSTILCVMNLSFQEKSIWSVLVSLLVVFGFYFYLISVAAMTPSQGLGLFIFAVVALVVMLAILHIGIALCNIRSATQDGDERDTLIELQAIRISSTVLAVGALLSASMWMTDTTPLNMANAILLSLVVSEIVQCVVQLVYYRRGF